MHRIEQGQHGIYIRVKTLHGASSKSSLTISGVTARTP
jgi:hypothetical protein